jgi:hypothetical protein
LSSKNITAPQGLLLEGLKLGNPGSICIAAANLTCCALLELCWHL